MMRITFIVLIVIKLCLVQLNMFNQITFSGLFIDFLIVTIILLIPISLGTSRRIGNIFYNIASLLVGFLLLVCTVYERFAGGIPTYQLITLVNQTGDVHNSIQSLFQFYDLIFIIDLLLLPLSIFKKSTDSALLKKGLLVFLEIFFVFILSSQIFVFQRKDIVNEFERVKALGIFGYNLSYEIGPLLSESKNKEAITPENIHKLKHITTKVNPNYYGIAKNKPIIVIQLEAFEEYIAKLKINGQEVTPNLNKFLKESHNFTQTYQNIGLGNTVDAEWVVNTSLYANDTSVMSEAYSDRLVPSLPRLISEKQHYVTGTFHTNVSTFYNRAKFYHALGFQHMFDQSYFGKSDVIAYGPSDEVLYNKTLDQLIKWEKENLSFYAQIITMSSHHPYKIPKEKQSFNLPSYLKETNLGNYIQAAHYSDKALGQFLNDLKKKNLYDKSLIIIYGDHFMSREGMSKKEKSIINECEKEPALMGGFQIVNGIKFPNQTKGEVHDELAGQVDLMPTILNLVGISNGKMILFGQDLFIKQENLVPQLMYYPRGSYLTNQHVYIPGKTIKTGKYLNQNGEKEEISSSVISDFERSERLLNMSESYVNHLPKLKNDH